MEGKQSQKLKALDLRIISWKYHIKWHFRTGIIKQFGNLISYKLIGLLCDMAVQYFIWELNYEAPWV